MLVKELIEKLSKIDGNLPVDVCVWGDLLSDSDTDLDVNIFRCRYGEKTLVCILGAEPTYEYERE